MTREALLARPMKLDKKRKTAILEVCQAVRLGRVKNASKQAVRQIYSRRKSNG